MRHVNPIERDYITLNLYISQTNKDAIELYVVCVVRWVSVNVPPSIWHNDTDGSGVEPIHKHSIILGNIPPFDTVCSLFGKAVSIKIDQIEMFSSIYAIERFSMREYRCYNDSLYILLNRFMHRTEQTKTTIYSYNRQKDCPNSCINK